MFRVALDLGGICLQGPLSLSVSQHPSGVANFNVVGFFVFCWAASCGTIIVLGWVASPPAVLDPNVLSKGVETGPTRTQIGPTCAQTMPCLPGACLRQAELF